MPVVGSVGHEMKIVDGAECPTRNRREVQFTLPDPVLRAPRLRDVCFGGIGCRRAIHLGHGSAIRPDDDGAAPGRPAGAFVGNNRSDSIQITGSE